MVSFGTTRQVFGEASIVIKAKTNDVFCFIAENFFFNYQKWAPEVIELQPLDGDKVFKGAKGRQVREDNDAHVESFFEITEFSPNSLFALKGIGKPYKQTFQIEDEEEGIQTKLSFRFDILEIELYMWPFEKLIRIAIEDGAENTVENIKELITAQYSQLEC
jgi:hypothetical protein